MPPPTNLSAGLHCDVVLAASRRASSSCPGARFDLFASSRRREAPCHRHADEPLVPAFDPRLSARVTSRPGRVALDPWACRTSIRACASATCRRRSCPCPGFPFDVSAAANRRAGESGRRARSCQRTSSLTATGFYLALLGPHRLERELLSVRPGRRRPPMPGDPVRRRTCAPTIDRCAVAPTVSSSCCAGRFRSA